MPIDTEQWRAQTGLFCASRVLLRPPRGKQPQPKVQADTLSLNMKFSLAVLIVTMRTGIFYASRTLQLLWLIACHASWLLSSVVKLSCRRLRGVSVLLALCLVVVQMLLIMSGDVEENPGPPKIQTTLGVSDLSCVREELLDVRSKWFDIGLKLKLSVGILEGIRGQYANPSEALREMLLHWLKKVDPPPTWEGLACALESCTVGEPRLAEQLRTKFCKIEGAAEGAIDRYASHLKSVYTSTELPTHCKWPPSSSKKFIHLAVVRKERLGKKKADAFTRAKIHGTEIDKIYQEKEGVNFSEVGKMIDESLAEVILVEGAPGIGKTTFAWEMCRKWAQGEILKKYSLVVLLRLGDKWMQEVKKISDFFYHPLADAKLAKEVETEILHCEEKSVLLLYEGFDELPRKLQEQQSIFLDVLHKKYLPDATILITSRPSATWYIRWKFNPQISQHFEILGFTKRDICSHAHDLIEDEQVRKAFLQYLKCYPYIRGMMYVPLNAVIVTELFKERHHSPERIIPTTITELYTDLTQSLLLRYLHNEYEPHVCNLKCFADLPSKDYKMFRKVTAVALKGIIEDRSVFDDLPKGFNTLDLMQSVPELYVAQGASVSYNFLHVTLQEYLAAVDISEQPVKKQIEFFEMSSPALGSRALSTQPLLPDIIIVPGISTRLRNVLRFVAGLTKFKGISLSSLQPLILNSLPQDFKDITLDSLHWLFESQCSDSYNELFSPYNLLTEHHSNMSPFDFFVLGYAMAHITSNWKINLRNSEIGDEEIEMLVAGVKFTIGPVTQSEENRRLQQLDISSNSIRVGGATALAKMLKESRTLQQLNISNNSIGIRGATALAQALQDNRTLQQLNVSNNSIGDGGATALAVVLKTNSTLQLLDVRYNCIGSTGATALAEMLKENRTLQQLDVSKNSVQDGGATALAEMLKENRTLQQLNVSNNYIGDKGATALAKELEENMTLQQLDIRDNFIHKEGATALEKMLKKKRTLQQLHVSCNSIGESGATALAEMSKENRSLLPLDVSRNTTGDKGATALEEVQKSKTLQQQQLYSSRNSIDDVGATALVEILKENRASKQLDISGHSVRDVGATELAKMLKGTRTLKQLTAHRNSLGDVGATALAEMLKENRTLQQLDISENSIHHGGATALAEMLKENRTLQQLNISKNSIGEVGATTLAEMLKENRTLQQLDISENSIHHGGATALAEMLKENRTLQQLNISKNSIGEVGATTLAEMLKENRTLQQLDISDNSIRRVGATALAEMLKENWTLQQLMVRDNSIGSEGAIALAKMLKDNRMLQQLDVRCNLICAKGARALAENLKGNRTLQQLNISKNLIGDLGAVELVHMLMENRTLQQLDIGKNHIGRYRGADALAEMLKENWTLQQLAIGGNPIGNDGATKVAEMLKENRTLKQLDVSDSSIDDEGATALANMLKDNRSLQQLDVSYNSIGDEGATKIAEMLTVNRTLQQLNVRYNSIDNGGATALAEMLKENVMLQQLNISKNSIGDVGAIELAEMLRENKTLKQLDVSSNSIGDEGVTALAKMLKKKNRTLQHLAVSNNSIGDRGATALTKVQKKNKTVSIIV